MFVQIAQPLLSHFGGSRVCSGPIETVYAPGDNTRVRQCLERNGQGHVLVVDGGGGMQCALLGDRLASLAVKNQWRGVIIHGCVRDTEALLGVPLVVMALAAHPKKSQKGGLGEVQVPLSFAGVQFHPGQFLYADWDGIVISPSKLDLVG